MTKQNKGRKLFATTATAALVASAIVPVASAAVLNDINSVPTWAKDAVQKLADNGVLEGDTKGNFNPNGVVTRAQAAQVFYKALGLSATGTENFSDVKPGDWWYQAVVATSPALFQGDGTGKFLPKAQLTRAEAAKVIVAAYGLTGEADLSTFSDASSVKAWAKDSLSTAVANGVINGKGTKLAPNDSITRAEFATMVVRASEAAVAPGVESVTAINATTVEVNFKENIEDINALDFKIAGLEVKNAVVKQTDSSVAVLTTATQEGGKEYTVTLGEATLGKFTGVSAVVPTSIVLQTTNTQAKVGNEVTLKADIGVKSAGVPVTFNVDAPTGSLNKDKVVEVYTDANGIATYSYTQYAADADDVTVYPTGAPQLRALGTVYWGVDNILTIEEVTTGNVLANGVKKTYKVKFKDPKSGAALSGRTLNVSFVENTNVAFNAISKATITNPVTGITETPYQTTTGLVKELSVTTDSNGEATFVVSGTNTSVTPYVFVDGSSSVVGTGTVVGTNNVQLSNQNDKWEATELTATAPQVKFEGAQLNHKITVERDGEEEAAAGIDNGREYKVKVLDKDGKAYANGLVNVALDEVIDKSLTTSSKAQLRNVKDGTALTLRAGSNGQQATLKLDSKGEATFVLYGADDVSGTPIVWIDQNVAENAQSGVLEDGEPFFKAPVSNFQFERVIGGNLTLEGKTSNQNIGTDGIANYEFFLTNQSGENLANLRGKLTYEIRNTSGQPIVVTTNGNVYNKQDGTTGTSFRIEEYGSITITREVTTQAESRLEVTAVNGGSGSVLVTPSFVTANNFDASNDNGATTDARDFNKYVTDEGLTATFSNNAEVGTNYTGVVQYYNTANSGTNSNTIQFAGKNPVKFAGESGKTYKYFGANGNEVFGETAFEALLDTYNTNNEDITVSYKVDGDTKTFSIIEVRAGVGPLPYPAPATPTVIAPSQQVAGAQAKSAVPAKYTSAVIAGSNFSDSSFTVSDGTNNAVVNVLGTDDAAAIAGKVNTALATATIDATASVENGRVVIVRDTAVGSEQIGVTASDIPTVFNIATSTTTAATPAVAGDYDYTFTVADITVGKTVTFNGSTYTAGTQNQAFTFDASGTLAQDLTNLAAAISYNSADVDASALTNVLTVVEEAGKEGTVTFGNIVISAN